MYAGWVTVSMVDFLLNSDNLRNGFPHWCPNPPVRRSSMKLRNATWFLPAATLMATPQKDTGAEKQLEAAIHTEMVKGDLKGAVEQYRKLSCRTENNGQWPL